MTDTTSKPRKGQILSTRQHLLKRASIYIGNTKNVETKKYVFVDGAIVEKNISYNEGLERIVIEILANIIDNKWDSEEQGLKMTKINLEVNQETGYITMSNDGLHITNEKITHIIEDERDAKKTTEVSLYPAEYFFGYYKAGNKLDDKEKKFTSGVNGLGSKLCNVYSKEFTVTCIDPVNKKKLVQTYSNNMVDRTVPKVTSCSNKTGFTEIKFLIDFEKFGVKGISDDFMSLLKKHAYDCSMTTNLPVNFNGEKIFVKNFKDYSLLYMKGFGLVPDEGNPRTMYFESSNCKVVLAEQSDADARSYGLRHISFTNGIYNRDGGVHVDKWVSGLLGSIVKSINGTDTKKKETKKKVENKTKITLEQVKKYFVIFITIKVENPAFDVQNKNKLIGFVDGSKEVIDVKKFDDKQLKNILKWDFLYHITEEIKFLENKKSSKTDGGGKGLSFIGNKHVNDANWAGTKNRGECTLFIAEGDSAKAMIESGITVLENGSDTIGVLAIKGKMLNATNKTTVQINDNVEIGLIKQLLGLKRGVDYTDEEEFKKLRYARVGLAVDSDVDGFHVSAMILALFYKEFYSLIMRGDFLFIWGSPSVKVSIKGKDNLLFYKHIDYLLWQEKQTPETLRKCKIKYYKGLGTFKYDDAGDCFLNPKNIDLFADKDTDYSDKINLGLNSKFADQRKDWLLNSDTAEEISKRSIIEGRMDLNTFIDERLKIYHLANNERMIPNIYDGLKDGQRMILYTCFKKNLQKRTVKVEQLSGMVLESAPYHHGSASLQSTIINMAQGFTGSNNIPLLVNDGQFGSLAGGGKDHASPRYISTGLEKITLSIFREEDNPLLDYVVDEGKTYHPVQYFPIICMPLVNGEEGIGSGFSTGINSHNPEDVVSWQKVWIEKTEKGENFVDDSNISDEDNDEVIRELDNPYPELVPWWRGYQGTVSLVKNKNGLYVKTEGSLRKDNKGMYHIEALPIMEWTTNFKEYLGKNFIEKKLITKLNTYNTPNSVHFEIKPHKDFQPDIASNLKKLVSQTKIGNMHLLKNNLPKKYDTVEDILEDYCEKRYEMYGKRKNMLLKKYKKELIRDKNKVRFIKEVMDGTLVMKDRKEEDVYKEMEEKGYEKLLEPSKEGEEVEEIDDEGEKKPKKEKHPYNYLVSMQFRSLTKEQIEKLNKAIQTTKNKVIELSKKSKGDLWNEDLDEFLVAYKTFLKTRQDDKKFKKTKK